VDLEKSAKGVEKTTQPAKELNMKFSKLENALYQALKPLQKPRCPANHTMLWWLPRLGSFDLHLLGSAGFSDSDLLRLQASLTEA